EPGRSRPRPPQARRPRRRRAGRRRGGHPLRCRLDEGLAQAPDPRHHPDLGRAAPQADLDPRADPRTHRGAVMTIPSAPVDQPTADTLALVDGDIVHSSDRETILYALASLAAEHAYKVDPADLSIMLAGNG